MKVCWELFNAIEITDDGSVYVCCEQRVSKFSVGNIFKDKFEDIWNCEKLVKMREAALKGEYPYCNHGICEKLSRGGVEKNDLFIEALPSYKPVMTLFPIQIAFPLERDCNAKCIYCRDEIISSKKEQIELFNDKFNNIYLPIMKDVSIFTVNDMGDAFGSKLSRQVIKNIINRYPKIKFKLMTNGICAGEKFIKELDLENRIVEFSISINAVCEKTHYKIFRVRGWKLLLKNLKYISKLKRKMGKIPSFHFKFVVCSNNWKEMAKFVKFASKYGANADFWEVRDYWTLENKYEDLAVHNETHKDFEAFVKSLVNPAFNEKHVVFSPLLMKLRNKAISEI